MPIIKGPYTLVSYGLLTMTNVFTNSKNEIVQWEGTIEAALVEGLNVNCTNCLNCTSCTECTDCLNCRHCTACVACSESQFCTDCRWCLLAERCQGCSRCINATSSKTCSRSYNIQDCTNCFSCVNTSRSSMCNNCTSCHTCDHLEYCTSVANSNNAKYLSRTNNADGNTICITTSDEWNISIYGESVRVGCQFHTIDEWLNFDDDDLMNMDLEDALPFRDKWLPRILPLLKEVQNEIQAKTPVHDGNNPSPRMDEETSINN